LIDFDQYVIANRLLIAYRLPRIHSGDKAISLLRRETPSVRHCESPSQLLIL